MCMSSPNQPPHSQHKAHFDVPCMLLGAASRLARCRPLIIVSRTARTPCWDRHVRLQKNGLFPGLALPFRRSCCCGAFDVRSELLPILIDVGSSLPFCCVSSRQQSDFGCGERTWAGLRSWRPFDFCDLQLRSSSVKMVTASARQPFPLRDLPEHIEHAILDMASAALRSPPCMDYPTVMRTYTTLALVCKRCTVTAPA